MFLCGDVSEKHRRLCSAVEEAVMAAIKECGPGVPFSRVGAAVQRVADRHKCASTATRSCSKSHPCA